MSVFVAVDNIDKVFELSNGGQYLALKGIDLQIKKGEFVSLIGHSGCGKSTLLNMIAGLDLPTEGVVTLESKAITKPGPDRMVVFQNYSLLPWLNVRENIELAVDEVMADLPKGERKSIVEKHIDMVGLRPHADKQPAMLSGGQKQRVAIARALAIRPKLLLLDEPFGALDALTRGNLQERLMEICDEYKVTSVMVTHDVDEAVLLSDRIVMLTNGPGSKIGQILDVDIPRPRKRMEVVNHPNYYSLRSEMIYFLNRQKQVKKRQASKAQVPISRNNLEKVNLEIGFVPLTACAPLAVAKERGFFAKYGLEEVKLVREPSWRGIVDDMVAGQLDAAQMPAGMPLWLTLGGNGGQSVPIVTSLTMARNGNAITLAKRFSEQGIYTLSDLKKYLQKSKDQQHIFGMVHPSSMHNLLLRYWLAAGGIDPDRDVSLTVIPPAQMVSNLQSGNIDGYCVGEPWNIRAAVEGIGFSIATDLEIWLGHPGKVLGVREDWAAAYPRTHLALITALLEAAQFCSQERHYEEVRQILARPEYVGTDIEYIQIGDPNVAICSLEHHREYAHHLFFGEGVNRPSRTEHLWILTQMARWDKVPFPRNWLEIMERLCRVDVFSMAARELGLFDFSYTRGKIELFDGITFNSEDPLAYLAQQKIKREFRIEEVALPVPERLKVA
ncbi:MAG: nitrate ABC transporter ATP-binding protein [Phormidium sp.]